MEDLSGQPLAATLPAISFRIVSNLAILQNPQIMSIIQSEPPNNFIDGWPDPLPPGILMLLAHEHAGVRRWAEKQASQSKTIPISRDKFSASHESAVEALSSALDPEQTQLTPFPFAKDPNLLCQGFRAALRLVPVEYLQTGKTYRVVNRHLHDTGSRKWFTHDTVDHSS